MTTLSHYLPRNVWVPYIKMKSITISLEFFENSTSKTWKNLENPGSFGALRDKKRVHVTVYAEPMFQDDCVVSLMTTPHGRTQYAAYEDLTKDEDPRE